jgi:LysM domain-containing protein
MSKMSEPWKADFGQELTEDQATITTGLTAYRNPPERRRPRWGLYVMILAGCIALLVAVWGFWPRSEHSVAAAPVVHPPAASERAKPKPTWPRHWRVRPGDSLAAISERFYGTEAGWYRIAAANDLQGSVIVPGERLVIPRP